MKIENDHWTTQQYIDLAATLKPGVTMKRLVIATKSSPKSVLYRLRGLHLVSVVEPHQEVDGSTGWRWIKSSRRDKLVVMNDDGSVKIDLFDELAKNGFFIDSSGRVRGPLFNWMRALNQLMVGGNPQ